MCGIVGCTFVDRQSVGSALLAIKHRGPDYSGLYVDDHTTLGHTLLSIRSTSKVSRQPYCEGDSPWILLFNGQIYNTSQIKKSHLDAHNQDLELDTAILYKLILKLGWDFISHIHGMYAIALYHRDEQTLNLYRDPAGQKPLYYYNRNSSLIFASEIKALLAFPTVAREPDLLGLELAVSLGYIPSARTHLANISKLNPGEVLSFDLNRKTASHSQMALKSTQYFTPNNPAQCFNQLLSEHAQSKYPVCINLSGGLDSALLLHELSSGGFKVHTFTNRITGPGANDRINSDADVALKLAADYGSKHTEIEINKELYLDNLVSAYSMVEEPSYNISLPMYLQTAKVEGASGAGERVVLAGHGGDELFGGYSYYQRNQRYHFIKMLIGVRLFNFLRNRKRKFSLNFGSSLQSWLAFKLFTSPQTEQEVNFDRVICELTEYFGRYQNEVNKKNRPVFDMMMCDRFIWQASESFIHSDKIFMSQSLELRAPLSYHPLREYFDLLQSSSDYFKDGQNKAWLRSHYLNKLPSYLFDKPKTGWRVPLESWFDRKFKERYLEILPKRAKGRNFINWDKVSDRIRTTDRWPGKDIQLYLSLAILAQDQKIAL